MQLWKRLYGVVWLAFFSCVIIPRWTGAKAGLWVHVVLGLAMLIMTLGNAKSLHALSVPSRLKRISKVTIGFAVLQVICGLGFGVVKHYLPDLPAAMQALRIAHLVCALAILAQASSLATAYDMWEEKEF
ncbi:MAG TPA: hypothetical protein VMG30_13230 [Acidobacteriota bacterium]|nr:hypothetical protein [Acidobacteriota bacterium]